MTSTLTESCPCTARPPVENRVVGLAGFTASTTSVTGSQVPETHQETADTSTWIVSEVGRWLSKDPIGINGGLNQYVFCGNNPVNRRDPFGLCENYDDPYYYSTVNIVSTVTGNLPYTPPPYQAPEPRLYWSAPRPPLRDRPWEPPRYEGPVLQEIGPGDWTDPSPQYTDVLLGMGAPAPPFMDNTQMGRMASFVPRVIGQAALRSAIPRPSLPILNYPQPDPGQPFYFILRTTLESGAGR